jgi:regulator of RNase E activity RraA
MESDLGHVEPGTVADVLRILEVPFYLRSGFKIATQPNTIVSGNIRTLKIERVSSKSQVTRNPNAPLQELIKSNCESEILFIHSETDEFAYLGEITGNILKYAGLKGVAIEGSTRDIVGIAKSGLALFSDGLTPLDVAGKDLKFTLDAPLYFNGSTLESGNFGYLSMDGLVAFDSRKLELVNSKVEKMVKKERNFLSKLDEKVSNSYLSEILDEHALASTNEI